jgi:hypothetical protein
MVVFTDLGRAFHNNMAFDPSAPTNINVIANNGEWSDLNIVRHCR